MEKEKLNLMQDNLTNGISKMIDEPNNIELFFNPSINPFLNNYKNARKFLDEKISKNIDILETESDVSSKSKMEYVFAKKYELDFCLYCAYAIELVKNETLFECNPPITDKISQYVYNHRIENYPKFKNMFKYYSEKINKNSIFVDNSKTVKNIINDNFGNAILANEKFLIDKKLQNKLAYEIKKYPITDAVYSKDKDGIEHYKRYYAGEYKGKVILFCEIVRVSKAKAIKDRKFSYQFNVVLNGDVEKNRILYRMDYNFGTNHIDKLNSNKTLNTRKNVVDIDLLKQKNVKNCHVHIPENKYAVIFPNQLNSCDTKGYDMVFKKEENFLEFNKNLIKAEDTVLLTNEQKDKIKQNNSIKKLNISDFIKHILSKLNDEMLENK